MKSVGIDHTKSVELTKLFLRPQSKVEGNFLPQSSAPGRSYNSHISLGKRKQLHDSSPFLAQIAFTIDEYCPLNDK